MSQPSRSSAPSTSPIEPGIVRAAVADGVASIEFSHPKGNSLPAALLRRLAEEFDTLGHREDVRLIVLRSGGRGPFCAGASFDELKAIRDWVAGKEFFMGFARLVLAMKNCSKLVLTRVQGKAVGGAVGIIAASDYVMAVTSASVRLSELAIGIGPFVVGPAIEKKIGPAAFGAMAIDADWRTAQWAEQLGLYSAVFESVAALDSAVEAFARKLAGSNPEALLRLKEIFRKGTEDWAGLLEARAEMSGRLAVSEYTRTAIEAFEKRS